MNELTNFIILSFTSLLSIVNPLSTAIVSLGFMVGISKKKKINIAKKAAITCFLVLTLFVFGGSFVFKIFSLSMEALRIAGGLVIIYIGFRMLNPQEFHKEVHPEHKKELEQKEDISIVPLAIPFLSGPGAITTTILLTSKSTSSTYHLLLVIVIAVISIISYYAIAHANKIHDLFGRSGVKTIEKIMGILILAIGVQFILVGIKDYILMMFL